MANTDTKRCLATLMNRRIELKLTGIYCYEFTEMSKIKLIDQISAREGTKELEFSYAPGGNVK